MKVTSYFLPTAYFVWLYDHFCLLAFRADRPEWSRNLFAWLLPENVSISLAAPVTPSYYPPSQQELKGLAKSHMRQDTGPRSLFLGRQF
jgi:hypothetical protein